MARKPQTIPSPWLMLAVIVAAHAAYAIMFWNQVPLRMDGIPVGPNDPDPWLRLTLVREWLLSGDWFNHAVPRTNAPFEGIVSPWTRPLDIVIATLVQLQPESVELNVRLLRAGLMLPPIWMGLLIMGIYQVIRQLRPLPCAYLMTCVIITATPIIWNYFGSGNADHHAPMAAIFMWVMAGVLNPAPSRRVILLTGLLMALHLWISVEAFMLIGIIYLWYGLHWLMGARERAAPLPWLATIVAIGAAMATFLERGTGGWPTPIYDSISIAYVFVLLLSALLAWAMHLIPCLTLKSRILLGSIGILAITAIVYVACPLMLHGPMAGLDPYVFTDFLPSISEARPLFALPLPHALGLSVQPLIVIWIALYCWRRGDTLFTVPQARAILYFVGALSIMYMSQTRWSYYLYPMTVVPLAIFLGALFTPDEISVRASWPARAISHYNEAGRAKRRLPIVFACIGLPIVLIIASGPYERYRYGNKADTLTDNNRACQTVTRQLIFSGALSQAVGEKPQTILISTDRGAEILFFTPHRIIASNYHREIDGIRYLWEANDLTNPTTLRKHLAQRAVDIVLLCPLENPPAGSVLQAWRAGARAPSWVTRVEYPLPKTSGLTTGNADAYRPTILRIRHER